MKVNTKNSWRLWGYPLVLVLCLLLNNTGSIDGLDRLLLDKQFTLLKIVAPRDVADDIVLVGINEETFDYYREPLALWHAHLNELFTGLAKAEPRGVLMDIILPERSYNFLGTDYDRQLLSGLLQLKKKTSLVTGQTVDEQGQIRPIYAPILSILGKKNTGLALVESDNDGVVRKLNHQLRTEKGEFDTMVGRMSALLNYDSNDGYIDYALGGAFDYVPMQKVSELIQSNEQAEVNKLFNNKVVFFGSVLPFVDRHPVPVPMAAWEPDEYNVPGVFIHMQALRSVINQSTIQQSNHWLSIFLLLLASSFWWLGQRFSLVFWALPTILSAMVLTSSLLLYHGVWMAIIGPAVTAIFFALTRVSIEGIQTWREKQLLKESFSGYVSPEVLKNIVQGQMHQGLGGESHEICVLFSDIRDFTTRSEGQQPHETISLLNRYFAEMTESVHANSGTVDKFIGDGMMAFFGAPNRLTNPSENAFAAARDMLHRLDSLNQQLDIEGVERIRIGIGLHFGNAVIGHVGSDARHEYTAIGDAVNVAARIEGLSKSIGYPIVFSEEVKNNLDQDFDSLGSQLIKGHTAKHIYGWKE
ncbi:MAG: adenylate cyclase [Chitinophagales bacterium]|jgi:adenylate cyclase